MTTPIYVDNNATTRVAPEVVEAMLPYFSELYGNPSSMHTFGGNVGQALREARARVAELLGATPEEIVFTSCGTESDSTAIWSALRSRPDRRHIITSRYYARGGMNQARRQLARLARNRRTARELCHSVAKKVARKNRGSLSKVERIRVVRGWFHMEEYFGKGNKTPVRERVYASCRVKRTHTKKTKKEAKGS